MPLRSITPRICSPPGGNLLRAVSSMHVHKRLLSSIGNSPAGHSIAQHSRGVQQGLHARVVIASQCGTDGAGVHINQSDPVAGLDACHWLCLLQ
jgi:hypothetical protein